MRKGVIRLALVTAFILLVPMIAMQVSDEWNWSGFDFAIAGALIFGTGLAYQLIARRSPGFAYRAAVGLALAAAFLLVWINGAVGIIGDGPVNVLYLAVPLVGVVGAVIARLEPHGMSRALFATAVAMAVVPVVALILGTPDFSPGVIAVFVLNSVFVGLFVGSALLFRRASALADRGVA